MKELQLPYIGVKIESIPTILRKVKETELDSDFIAYYQGIGKASKTASEYLASLRNLKLAKRKSPDKTVLLPAGLSMIQDDVNKLYISLLQHCLKNFQDLKIVRDTIIAHKVVTLPQLISSLSSQGFQLKRKQTLSSYLKLIIEGDKKTSKRQSIYLSKAYDLELLEFNQFLKMLIAFSKKLNMKRFPIIEFFNWLSNKAPIDRELFTEYLKVLRTGEKYRLVEVNTRVLKKTDDGFFINGRLFYYIDLSL